MKKYIYKGGLFLLVVVAVSLPAITLGALIPCTGPECQACHLKELLARIINFIIMIGSLFATLIFMWAGFTYVTAGGDTSKIKQATETFKNVAIGVIIMLLGYLIVNTVMKTLVDPRFFDGKPWDDVRCVPQPVFVAGKRLPQDAVTVILPGGGVGTVTSENDAQVRAALTASGVRFNSDVNLVGASHQRLSEIASMAETCKAQMGQDCGVVISSGVRLPGNPAGVGAHVAGGAIDISGRSEVFNTWMRERSGYPSVASFGGYRAVQTPASTCTWEGVGDRHSPNAHWHCQS